MRAVVAMYKALDQRSNRVRDELAVHDLVPCLIVVFAQLNQTLQRAAVVCCCWPWPWPAPPVGGVRGSLPGVGVEVAFSLKTWRHIGQRP